MSLCLASPCSPQISPPLSLPTVYVRMPHLVGLECAQRKHGRLSLQSHGRVRETLTPTIRYLLNIRISYI